ncbi:M20/M25/M40 family metallo-hydrolase [bacterium]|nr:M20/M25/M40 family metallo-hydrolase [bacterium]
MIKPKQITKTFVDLVKIDSLSGKERKVAAYIIKYLKNFGIKSGRDSYGNVIARIPGKGEPFILSAHMDTVQPGIGIKPIIKKGIIKSNGTTILGADDKAGITAILEAVKECEKRKLQHRPLELIFTREEEIGCVGAKQLNFKKLKAKEGLAIDSASPLGHITLAEPFIYIIEIWVKGRAAHGGAHPEKGIDALHIAAKALSEIKLGRINKSTTANMGIIEGGTAFNTVPENIYIKGDVRSHFLKQAQQQVDIINKAFKKQVRLKKARLKFKATLTFNGFNYLKSDRLIKKIANLNKEMKFRTVFERSGGASDASIFAGKGIKVINISYGGRGGHTTKETIKVRELTRLTEFIIKFIN